MCTGGLPKIRADKHHQLSHPRFLCWVALVVVREWVLSRPAVPSPASSFYSAVFCLWILLTWCFMNLRWLFSPIICIFPFWVSSSSASLGTGGRSQVWPSGHPPALRAWVFLWQVTSAGPQLSAGLEGCKQHLYPLLLLLMILATIVLAFALFFLLMLSHISTFIHSSYQPVFLSQPLHLYNAHESQTMNVITVTQQPSDNSSQKAPFPFIT